MKITLSIDSKHSMEVAYPDLASFLSFFSDDPSGADFYSELAKHPSSMMRVEVAGKTCLPVATLEKLAADPSIEVVQKVARNETALGAFSADQFKAMIRRDVSVALELARGLDSMNLSVGEAVKAELMKHEDPLVWGAVRDNEW